MIADYKSFALVSDIGGTKTPLALFGQKKDGSTKHIFTLIWKSRDITNFTDAINESLRFAYDEYKITADRMKAAFGVAGPIQNNRTYAKPTNLFWHVDAEDIKKNSYLKNIVLLNDFEVIGYGIDQLSPTDVVQLNDCVDETGTAAIIGAGTGLGTSILFYDSKSKRHIPIAGEGGHATFQIIDEEDEKIIRFIKKKKKLKTMPGYELLVSGPGLANIYEYYASKKLFKGKAHKEISKSYDKSAMIAKYCRTDKVCRLAMDSFLKYYGRAAGNLALVSYPKGGLFIAGGIAPKIIEELDNGIFIREFENNYRMFRLLNNTAVFVVMNPDIGLLGAANAAFNFYDDLID